ncbi:MAG: DNA polymerase III subunit delta [Rickettsiales bacterium]|jgi:DNA polymerase-3 subunit delta|nr:DNA polymerase III subunit delta [Rickettsiales bacterium]
MKLKETDFSNLVKTKMANVPAVLFYGPDNGKCREFADEIAKALDVPKDNLITVAGAAFREKFDAIYTDACSASMFGGNKLVIVDNMDGRDLPLLKNLCDSKSLCAPVIVIDGELETKSTLRAYFEESESCAALPLYADGDQALSALCRKTLSDFGVTQIEDDALSYMLQHIGKDRAVAKGFLQKIALYAGGNSVRLEDVEKCLPDTGAASMDEFKHNLTAGNIMQALRALDRLFSENVYPAQMVRALGNHFKDLVSCVVGGQMPRVFYKYEKLFDAARRIWGESDLSSVLVKINRLEADTRGNMDPELAFRDFSLKLAAKAYKLRTAAGRKAVG